MMSPAVSTELDTLEQAVVPGVDDVVRAVRDLLLE